MSKKLLKFISTAFIAVFIFGIQNTSTTFAQSQSNTDSGFDSYYSIDGFDSVTNISKADVKVKETIKVNFTASSHGIFRTLGETYEYHSQDKSTNQVSRLIIKVSSITDENEVSIPFETYDLRDSIYNENDLLTGFFYDAKIIKIGDPNQLLFGPKTFIINYSISNYPESPAVLDYPLSGLGWSQSINNFTATINFEKAPTEFKCLSGKVKDPSPGDCKLTKISDTQYKIIDDTIPYKYALQLNIKGLEFDHTTSDTVLFLTRNWYFFAAIIISLLSATIALILRRVPKGSGVITPQFSIPDNLRPAEVGTIYDDSVDRVELSATIIDLAVRGYLKIKDLSQDKNKQDFQILLIKPIDEKLKTYEKILITNLFGSDNQIMLNSGTTNIKFPKIYEDIQNNIYLWGVLEGYFRSKPDKKNSFAYAAVLAAVFAGPGIVFNLISIVQAILIGLVAFLFGIIIFVTRVYKTEKGVLEREKIEGLKLFIEFAKKDQLEMLQTPKQELFEQTLPYAMVLGQHEAWAKAFKDLNITQPDWYEGNGNMLNTLLWVSYINTFSNTVNTVFAIPFNETGVGSVAGIVGGSIGGGFSSGGGRW